MKLPHPVIWLIVLANLVLFAGCAGGGTPSSPTSTVSAGGASARLETTQIAATATISPSMETATVVTTPSPTATATPNLAQTNRWQSLGPVDGANISAIAISPDYAKDKTIFVGTLTTTEPSQIALGESLTTGAAFKSGDGGLSWKIISTTLSKWGITALAVSPDYARDKTVLAGTFGTFPGANGNLTTADARLSRSHDGGLNWGSSQTGLPGLRVVDVVFSPDYFADRTVLVALGGLGERKLNPPKGGIFKSVNGGTKWAPTSMGLPQDLPATAIGFSPEYGSDGVIFLSTTAGSDQSGARGSTFRSMDKGLSWQSVASAMTPGFSQARNFAASPRYATDFTIFASDDAKGIYRSTDGGATWKFASSGIDDVVTTVALSPGYISDSTLYAATRNSGIFKSSNAGLTWAPLNEGLTYLSATTLAVTPTDPPVLLAGIKDRGLWHYVDKR